jgi:hypothetical protein
MMRFPTKLICNERNDRLCSENVYGVFATIPRIDLGLKQAAIYPPRSIQYGDSTHTVIQKFQDDLPPFRMWIDFLLYNEWIARYRDIILVRSFIYCTIATINYNLQNKVASTKTSIFPDIAKGVKKSEN